MGISMYRRRAIIGALSGLASSPALLATLDNVPMALLAGMAIGAGFAVIFRPSRHAYMDTAMTAAATGVPLWIVISVLARPLVISHAAAWDSAGMRALFPALVGWVLYGALLGVLLQACTDASRRWLGPDEERTVPRPAVRTRVVILGGGFAGVTTATYLEHLFGSDPTISLTLVSETNALLFTPMLAEVAASSLEPTHISSPLRTSLRRTSVVRGRAAAIDLDRRCVALAPDHRSPQERELPYDHLVLALGGVSNYLGLAGVASNSFEFKSLADAMRIRNHAIDMFERAEHEPDPARRKAMLTFVVAGGGFAGVELAGGLNDFTRGMLAYYPGIVREDLRIMLVHSRERILPELSETLGSYARRRMAARGVSFLLGARVEDARPGAVMLSTKEEIATETLVWTAGTRPHPLVETLECGRDARGAVIVEATLAVPNVSGLWALGDCASVPDLVTGKTCPPTAQYALRQAKTLAANIQASSAGKPLKPFRFAALGVLCVVGHQTACAELKGLRFSGLFAWFLWRGIYLAKLPGLERKIRVLVDWVVELFFPRDIVQTVDFGNEKG